MDSPDFLSRFVPSATFLARSSKFLKHAGGPIDTPAPANTTSLLSFSADIISSGKSILPHSIVLEVPSSALGRLVLVQIDG